MSASVEVTYTWPEVDARTGMTTHAEVSFHARKFCGLWWSRQGVFSDSGLGTLRDKWRAIASGLSERSIPAPLSAVWPAGTYVEWFARETGRMQRIDVTGQLRSARYFDPVTRERLSPVVPR